MSDKNDRFDLLFSEIEQHFSGQGSIELSAVVRGFLLSLELENRTPDTLSYNKGILSRFLWFAEQNRWPSSFDQITTHHVRLFLDYVKTNPNRWGSGHARASKPVKPITVLRYRAVLHAMWNWAVQEELAETNIVTRIRVPKVERKLPEHLSETEIRKLIDTCRHAGENARRDTAIVLLLLDTGLRASELCGLTRENWDVEACRVKVLGKGRKERYLPMSPLTAKALWDYDTRERPRSPYREIFLTRDGDPLTVDGLESMLARRSQKAGIRHVHPHLMRHTFASTWARNGGPTAALQTLLGHNTPTMALWYAQQNSAEAVELHREYSPIERLGLRFRDKKGKR